MKKNLKLFLLMLLALMTSLPTVVLADDDEPEPDDIPIEPYPHIKIPRPRARALNFNVEVYPECSYCNGIVTISAAPDITSISAEVECLEDGQVWSDSSAGNILVLEVSADPGTYGLLLTLSNGKSYYGEYSIQ